MEGTGAPRPCTRWNGAPGSLRLTGAIHPSTGAQVSRAGSHRSSWQLCKWNRFSRRIWQVHQKYCQAIRKLKAHWLWRGHHTGTKRSCNFIECCLLAKDISIYIYRHVYTYIYIHMYFFISMPLYLYASSHISVSLHTYTGIVVYPYEEVVASAKVQIGSPRPRLFVTQT